MLNNKNQMNEALDYSIDLCDWNCALSAIQECIPCSLDFIEKNKITETKQTVDLFIAHTLYSAKEYKSCLKYLEPFGDTVAETESLCCLIANCWIHLQQFNEAESFIKSIYGTHYNNINPIDLTNETIKTNSTSIPPVLIYTEPPQYPRLRYLQFICLRSIITGVNLSSSNTLLYAESEMSQKDNLNMTPVDSVTTPTHCYRIDQAIQLLSDTRRQKHNAQTKKDNGSDILILLEQLFLSGEYLSRDQTEGFSLLFTSSRTKEFIINCPTMPRTHPFQLRTAREELEYWLSYVVSPTLPLMRYTAPLIQAERARRHVSKSIALSYLNRSSQFIPYSLPIIYTGLEICLSHGSVDSIASMSNAFINAELSSSKNDHMTSEDPFLKTIALWALGLGSLLDTKGHRRANALTAQQHLGEALRLCSNMFRIWLHFSKAYQMSQQLDQAILACRMAKHIASTHPDVSKQWNTIREFAGEHMNPCLFS